MRREWSALLEAQAGQASAGRGAEGWQRGGFHLRQEQLSWMGVLAGLAGAAQPEHFSPEFCPQEEQASLVC